MVLSLIITATMLLCGTYMVSADAQTSGTQQVGTEHALTAAGEAVGEALTSALATGSSAGTAATGPALSGGYVSLLMLIYLSSTSYCIISTCLINQSSSVLADHSVLSASMLGSGGGAWWENVTSL